MALKTVCDVAPHPVDGVLVPHSHRVPSHDARCQARYLILAIAALTLLLLGNPN